jgi:hypothetical protein
MECEWELIPRSYVRLLGVHKAPHFYSQDEVGLLNKPAPAAKPSAQLQIRFNNFEFFELRSFSTILQRFTNLSNNGHHHQ